MNGRRTKWLGGAAVALALLAAASGAPAQAQGGPRPVPATWADIRGFDLYEWIDRADALSDAIGDAPPDESFRFAGGTPLAWMLDDGSVMIVETEPDGPHSYYYEPGAEGPFLVRGPRTAFGYVQDAPAVVYSSDGGVLSRIEAASWFTPALEDWRHGRDLRRALMRTDARESVDLVDWFALAGTFVLWHQQWDEGKRRHAGWGRYHQRRDAEQWRRRHDDERRRREALAERFRYWRQGGFQGRPPGPWQPPRGGGAGQPVGGPIVPGQPGGRPPRGPVIVPGQAGPAPGQGNPPRGTWPRPRPSGDAPGTPMAGSDNGGAVPQGDGRPGRGPRPGGWTGTGNGAGNGGGSNGGDRPGRGLRPGGWTAGSPAAPAAVPAPSPVPAPVANSPTPAPAPVASPPRRDPPAAGGWRGNRGGNDDSPRSFGRPVTVAPQPAPGPAYRPAPAPAPAPVTRSFTPPPSPAPAPRSYSPPPAPRSYSPPAPRPAPAPAPAPAPRSDAAKSD
ncbi:hypothetical protein [Sphingomonas sp.]|uniref:hypothetical protein n=1 Tax=Sphingomonas sp. TaxID=28214 RepID=UPI001B1942AA|nr:hypothetical protein [Sphingomonas sp.]MBO9715176.1 hypothetical protein [Sphingomonas sp.]